MFKRSIGCAVIGFITFVLFIGCQTTASEIPAKTLMENPASVGGPFPKDGFVTFDEDGRIWVFRTDAKELPEYKDKGELAKFVVRPAAGPERRTLKAPDSETIVDYMTRKKGFVTFEEEGRLWVFVEGAKELAEYKDKGELAKFVVRPAAGPLGMTLKAPDAETLDAYRDAN